MTQPPNNCTTRFGKSDNQIYHQLNSYTLNPARFPRIEGASGNVSEHHTSRSSWPSSRTVSRMQWTSFVLGLLTYFWMLNIKLVLNITVALLLNLTLLHNNKHLVQSIKVQNLALKSMTITWCTTAYDAADNAVYESVAWWSKADVVFDNTDNQIDIFTTSDIFLSSDSVISEF